jgi:hypothetical protein
MEWHSDYLNLTCSLVALVGGDNCHHLMHAPV